MYFDSLATRVIGWTYPAHKPSAVPFLLRKAIAGTLIRTLLVAHKLGFGGNTPKKRSAADVEFCAINIDVRGCGVGSPQTSTRHDKQNNGVEFKQ